MPLGHLGLNVPDLEAAREHYAAVMPALGFEPFLDAPDEFAYRPANGKPGTYLFFYPAAGGAYAPRAPGLQHLAFVLRSRTEVRRIRDLVKGLGCAILHEPREWPQYPPPYYATFWRDPFGFTLEAVCHHDRD